MILAIIAFVGVYLLFRQGPPEFERSPFWADEFDICDTFNYKWSALQGCGIGSYGHGQLFDDSAKSINCTNGSLVLTDNWEQQKKLNCYDIRRKTKYTSVNYTSVRLLAETSLGPFGKIDIRARADAPSGFWPAANLYPNHDCGQKKSCFAVEGIAKFLSVPGGSDSATSEFSYPQDGKGKKVWMPRATDQFPEGWAKDFHVWTLTWTQERVEILIDDVLVNALDTSADSVGAWRSPGRLVIELNVLTGDQKPLKSIKSASFEIDYVRYYRLKDYAY
jgi:beta-glucanase (GH16 family)